MRVNSDSRGARRLSPILPMAFLAFSGVGFSQGSPPDFTGVWSGNFTTKDSDYWQIEDFTACFAGCPRAARQYLTDLLDHPANDDRPIPELLGETVRFAREDLASRSTPEGLALQAANSVANDTVLDCKPYGLVRLATNPLTMAIHQQGEHLEIQYEEWNLSRIIYMDGRSHPMDLEPTALGHSVGRYDGESLVIETKGIEADLYFAFQSGGGHSDEAIVVERYLIHDEPTRLELELTVTDSVTLNEPHTLVKTWLLTPDVELVEDSCADVPGVF